MRIVSWNVNGLRACEKKGFRGWLDGSNADVIGLQEVRALPEQLPSNVRAIDGWHVQFAPAARLGYSGVALYSRRAPDAVITSIDVPEFDAEGRVVIARFGQLVVANVYFPNGNGKNRDNSRIPFKLAFYRRLLEVLDAERALGRRVVVMGDFNTAHREIDLARPKENVATSGFRPEERAELDRWIRAGWVDSFRRFNDQPGQYTWWSARFGVRAKNIGWRIDLVLACPEAASHLADGFIHAGVPGSDHCPLGVELDDAVLAAPPAIRARPVAAALVARPKSKLLEK